MTTETPKFIDPDKDLIPPLLLRAMGLLIVITLAIVTFAVLTGRGHEASPLKLGEAKVVAERQFVIAGDPITGAVTLTEPNGTLITSFDINQGGFLSTVHRVLKRARQQRGVPMDTPLRLVRFENGQLTLIDMADGWATTLNGFGADNEATFARLLEG